MKHLILKCLLFQFILAFNLKPLFLHAQDANQSGFISIDCGLDSPDRYTDTVTGIEYTSDSGFLASSDSKAFSSSTNISEKQLLTLRSFPKGKRNCYTVTTSTGKGQKYLIRTRFAYGNYDSLNQPPTFDIYLGPDFWGTVSTDSPVVKQEIVHVLSSDYVHICLVNTGQGTPFISVLELRPLNSTNSIYTPKSGSLRLWNRYHFNSDTTIIRYPDDVYDRRWLTTTVRNTTTLYSTSSNIYYVNDYLVPGTVMSTASTPDSSTTPFQFQWETSNPKDQFYLYLHFAEVQKLEANQTREFNIYLNNDIKPWNSDGAVIPSHSRVTTYRSTSTKAGYTDYILELRETKTSTLLPIINAIEIYFATEFSSLSTEEAEVAAMISIKSIYGLLTTKDWQGDPCYPKELVWDGLVCSYDNLDHGRIISLNLSKSSLKGSIAPSIANLVLLKSLDLSYNNLSGEVPDFLSQLAFLTILNLKGNNFNGSIPEKILEKWKTGLLQLSFDGPGNSTSTDLCQSTLCKKKKKNSSLPIVAAIAAAVLLLALISFGIWMFLRRKQPVATNVELITQRNEGELARKDRRFTYSEVLTITNNFQKVLGRGGFGTVYHGYVGDTQVAVKMLSPSSAQGYKEFQVEATLLMSIHHKNLSSLVGYCNEGTAMGIIYEFMANGNLHEHISERSPKILGWKDRLRIAMETAQGLEYLHHGCKPSIIHRDVKPSNILLNEQFQAKLADFGLSRAYSVEGGTHVLTVVAGTPGYLDPDYSTSNRLTEKSDVYSFGIVMLEMITGRPAIMPRIIKSIHIVEWVDSKVQNGDIIQILDPRFGGDYDVNSAWKAVELAMTCASKYAPVRPTMNSVVIDLKECLAIEISRNDFGSRSPVNGDVLSSDTLPLAR